MTHEGPRGRRRSTPLATSVVLGIVAVMLAVTSFATGEPKILLVAAVLGAAALLLYLGPGRRRTTQ